MNWKGPGLTPGPFPLLVPQRNYMFSLLLEGNAVTRLWRRASSTQVRELVNPFLRVRLQHEGDLITKVAFVVNGSLEVTHRYSINGSRITICGQTTHVELVVAVIDGYPDTIRVALGSVVRTHEWVALKPVNVMPLKPSIRRDQHGHWTA